MKGKIIILLLILLFNINLFSQEFYLGYRVVTREEIEGLDFAIIRHDDGVDVLILEDSGEVVLVKYEK